MQQIKNLAFDYLNNSSIFFKDSELQDIHITENTNIESLQDGPAVITRCKNLTIDAGATWSLSNRCERWDIIINGNAVINGIISLDSKGISRAGNITCNIYGFFGKKNQKIVNSGDIDFNNAFDWNLKSFTINSGGIATDGGIINIYCSGNITVGVTGEVTADGASGKNGGTVHVYYVGNFILSGNITASGGTGGNAGTVTIEDLSYIITEYKKTLATGEYIYTIIDIGGGKAMIGTKSTGKVFYTEDWGLNWTDQGRLGTATCVRCFLDFGSGHIWAGVGSTSSAGAKIYETLNYGTQWTLKATLGTQKRVASMCNLSGGILLAGTWDGGRIYKTIDSGLNWTDKGSFDSFNVRSLLHLGGDNVLMGGRFGAIKLSTDAGNTWTLKATLSGADKVRYFLLLSDGSIIAGDQKGKIYKCNGSPYTTWTLKKTFYTKQEIVEFKNIIGNKILVSMSPTKVSSTDTQKHVAVTEDAGDTWRVIDSLTSTQTNSYGVNRQNVFFKGITNEWLNIPINHFGAY